MTGMALTAQVAADTMAIIGTGRVAGALGPRLAGLGHRVVYGSRDPAGDKARELAARTGANASVTAPAEAAAQADIILLAVPWTAVESVIKGLGNLSGKIVIDPTNPYRRTEAGLAEHTVDSSAGEMIQGWLPQARVVKAFNTLSYLTMAEPGSAGGPVTIPLVGDDAEAKAAVARLVEGLGMEPMDLGPIRYAHEVEGMLIVWANARLAGRPFDYHLRRAPGN
jgi:hypothetical protein